MMAIAVQPITIASFNSFRLYEKEFSMMGLNVDTVKSVT
jgi:hypothetical protein